MPDKTAVRSSRTMWLISVPVAAVSFVAGFVILGPEGKPRADGAAPAGTLRGMLAGRFSAASEDRVAALFAAFDEREPLRRDAAIFRAIEQLEPGDALGAPGDLAALIERVEKLPRDLWPHVAEAILERWLAIDPAGAFRWLETTQKMVALNAEAFGTWDPQTFSKSIEVLARREPEGAIRHALTLPANAAPGFPRGEGRGAVLRAIFMELSARDPAAARRRLAELPEADRKDARDGMKWGLAKTDPTAALAMTLGVPGPLDMNSVGMLVSAAARTRRRGMQSPGSPTPPTARG